MNSFVFSAPVQISSWWQQMTLCSQILKTYEPSQLNMSAVIIILLLLSVLLSL